MQAQFDLVLNQILTNLPPPQTEQPRIAVAYSGGLDSAVLLKLCATFAQHHSLPLMALHVHHGLSSNANAWVVHCEQQCKAMDIPFEVAYVQLGQTQDEGIEATARKKRYSALGQLSQQHQIDVLLTAHHQDDQAETLLLQLLRGAGIAGLCGMQQSHYAKSLLENETLLLVRPLLNATREEIERYATEHQIQHIEDESNLDERFARNALRHQIMPLLEQHFPGFQSRFARTALHAQSALVLLEQLAQQDYRLCLSESNSRELNVVTLQDLPDERIDNVLRYWIAVHNVQMPSAARLSEIRKQLLHARDDAQVCVKHGEVEVHRYRQQLSIAKCAPPTPDVISFVWQGQASIAFPSFAGQLCFHQAQPDQFGIPSKWLAEQRLQIRPRQGGERLKLAPNRPTRDMKSHYQTAGIAYWQRERLPFVFADKELVFAAGIGMNGALSALQVNGDQADCYVLEWQAD